MKTNTRLLILLLFFATSVNMAFSATAVERECRYTDFSLTATPDKGFYGEEVSLSATASNLLPEGVVFQWLKWGIDDISGQETIVPIAITTDGKFSYTIDQDTLTIMVVAQGCAAEVMIEELVFGLESIDRECNDIILQTVVRLGVDKTISYKWQRSADGRQWEDIDKSAVTPYEVQGLEDCFKITITEKSMFRIAEIYATSGRETGLYSDVTEIYELKDCPSDDPSEDPSDDPSEDPSDDPSDETSNDIVWPTVFTPMVVDGYNDDFVMGMNPPVSLKIFDRYGLLVVETADGWDGKYPNGQYAMPGVYYYVATFQNGDTFKGNVELLNEQQK